MCLLGYKTLKERYERPSFISIPNIEQLLLTSINGKSYQKEYDDFVSDDFVLVSTDKVETRTLLSELLILRTIFESLETFHFGDIAKKLKTISPQERISINNLISIIKILVKTGATRPRCSMKQKTLESSSYFAFTKGHGRQTVA